MPSSKGLRASRARALLPILLLAGSLLPLPDCSGNGRIADGTIQVTSVDIVILESFPVQVHVLVRGYLPDSCSGVGPYSREKSGTTFRVTLKSVRDPGQICTRVPAPFETSVPLDVYGLPAGTYLVDVNGVTGSFTLDIDNRL